MTTTQSKLSTAARMLMGAIFLVFGANGFLQFLPTPPMPAAAGAFAGAMMSAGYLFPLLKGTEIVVGALLLSGRYVPLALAVIAPVIVNIVGFHAALAPQGLAIPLVLLASEIYLAWSYRSAFAPMLQARAKSAPVRGAPAQGTLAPAS